MTRLAAALAAAALVLSAGCGIPDDDEPRVVAAGDAPVDLSPTTEAPEASSPEGGESANVFFIDRDTGLLRQVRRSVERLTPGDVIRSLLAGVREDDDEALTTAIPADTQLVDTSLEGTTLVVNLAPAQPGGILSVVGATQLQAFAQIVRTVTGLSGISSVLFRVEGQPISAPTDSGASDEPVDRGDYASLTPGQG